MTRYNRVWNFIKKIGYLLTTIYNEKYPQRRMSPDTSKPMQSFRLISVSSFLPSSFWQVANNTEGENKFIPVHLFVILAAHSNAITLATRERMRMGYISVLKHQSTRPRVYL
jgi:hypothetical protein